MNEMMNRDPFANEEAWINSRYNESRAREAMAKHSARKEAAHKSAVRADFRARLLEVLACCSMSASVMVCANADLINGNLALSIAVIGLCGASMQAGRFIGRWKR